MKKIILIFITIIILCGIFYLYRNYQQKNKTNPTNNISESLIEYKNEEYDFIFTLPKTWQWYSILDETWQGESLNSYGINIDSEKGTKIIIRHPDWKESEPMQDIPIMIFTKDQWNNLQQDKFHIGAAPINPSKLGENNNYVFALPARYNFAFLKGYKEVEDIINNNPLVDLFWTDIKNAINNCNVKSIMQTHEQKVSAKLKDGNEINAFEPKIDEIMDIAVAVEPKCGKIIMATE